MSSAIKLPPGSLLITRIFSTARLWESQLPPSWEVKTLPPRLVCPGRNPLANTVITWREKKAILSSQSPFASGDSSEDMRIETWLFEDLAATVELVIISTVGPAGATLT